MAMGGVNMRMGMGMVVILLVYAIHQPMLSTEVMLYYNVPTRASRPL
jgi:hypothetical protein